MAKSQNQSQAGKKKIVPGNAAIAGLEPTKTQEQERREHDAAVAGEELRPKGKQAPNVAADARKDREGKAQPDRVVENNVVDEAGWESFPASDPPSFSGGASTPSDKSDK